MNMHTLNLWAVVVASVSAFVIGGLWYLVDGATRPGIPTITALSNKVDVFTPTSAK